MLLPFEYHWPFSSTNELELYSLFFFVCNSLETLLVDMMSHRSLCPGQNPALACIQTAPASEMHSSNDYLSCLR